MPFTSQEIENLAASAIDYHWNTPTVRAQSIQDKPLLKMMMGKVKNFPGGKELLTARVKGDYTTTIQGFDSDDPVSYANPANTKTASVPYKFIHAGIQFSMPELVRAGITVDDTLTGEKTSRASMAEKIALTNLLQEKIEDMAEGSDRGLNTMFWRDGTQDSKLVPGLTAYITDTPTADVTVAGLNQSVYSWWRNRANISISLGAGPSTGAVLNTLQYEMRQLRRYGGKPNTMLAGSDMMDRIEKELKAAGYYTQTGWAGKGRIDGSVSDLSFKGIDIDYDPTLDDLGYSKRLYVIDSRRLYLMTVDGENGKDHAPARPEDKYVFYRAKTWVLGLMCDQRNCHGVYAFP